MDTDQVNALIQLMAEAQRQQAQMQNQQHPLGPLPALSQLQPAPRTWGDTIKDVLEGMRVATSAKFGTALTAGDVVRTVSISILGFVFAFIVLFISYWLSVALFIVHLALFTMTNKFIVEQAAQQRELRDTGFSNLWRLAGCSAMAVLTSYLLPRVVPFDDFHPIVTLTSTTSFPTVTLIQSLFLADWVFLYAGMSIKLLLLHLVPTSSDSSTRFQSIFSLMEHSSLFIRGTLKLFVWMAYFQPMQFGYMAYFVVLVLFLVQLGVTWSFYFPLRAAATLLMGTPVFGKLIRVPHHSSEESETDDMCAICRDSYTEPLQLSCKHVFCHACISQWAAKKSECPLCRAAINKNSISLTNGGSLP